MLEHFVPEDEYHNDNDHHKQIRQQARQPLETPNDEKFTKEEVLLVLEKFNPDKAPGDDGINSEIMLKTFKRFPTFFTEIYNSCLKEGKFPKQWKRSSIVPIVKPGKEKETEVSKFRPISLINIGGKILEKLLIDRINHHLYSNDLLNNSQYGFIPQRSTVEAALAAKEFMETNLQQKKCVVLVSLDVKGAFDAAWWPSVLSNLRKLRCPQNLYKLTEGYFRDRVATLQLNTYKTERKVTKGCPQG